MRASGGYSLSRLSGGFWSSWRIVSERANIVLNIVLNGKLSIVK